MAITPADWSHYVTIPESYTPSSATSGQTLVITDSVIAKLSAGDQATFWSNVENGGGDVRICTDAGGVNQLPVDVLGLDSTNKTLTIITRKPSYNGTDDLYLFIGNAGATQPAVTDTYGRNAVWQDELNVYLGSTVDRAGNKDLAITGSVTELDDSGPLPSFLLDGSTGYLEAASYYPVTGSASRSVRGWLKTINTSNQSVISWGDDAALGSNGARWELRQDGGKIRTEVNGGFEVGSSLVNDGNFNHYARSFVGSNVTDTIQYVNGAVESVSSSGSRSVNTLSIEPLRIGARPQSGSINYFWNGSLSIILRDSTVSSEFVATEYANQNDPANFYGTPTITPLASPAVEVDIDFAISAPSFSVTASASLPQPESDVDFSVGSPAFSASASATLPDPAAQVGFSVSGPAFSASASATLPSPDSSIDFDISSPVFSVVAFAGTIDIIVDDETNINLPGLSNNVTLPALSNNIDL